MSVVHRTQLSDGNNKLTAHQHQSNDDVRHDTLGNDVTHDTLSNDAMRQRLSNDAAHGALSNDVIRQRRSNAGTHRTLSNDATCQRPSNDVMQHRFRNDIHPNLRRDVVMFGNQQLTNDVRNAGLNNDIARHMLRHDMVHNMRNSDVTKHRSGCDVTHQRATNGVIEHRLRNEFIHNRHTNDVMNYRLCNTMANFAQQEQNQLRLWSQMDLSFLQLSGGFLPRNDYLHSRTVTSPESGASLIPIRPASAATVVTTASLTGGIAGNHSNARALIDANVLLPHPHHIAIPLPHWDFRFAASTNYNRRMFRCSQCRYVTDRRNNLKRHILTMHQTTSKLLECCGVLFSTKASLREHSMIFHFNGYNCHFCNRRFCRKALLKRHLSVHNGQKDFLCSVCDYATSHKSNLERHRKVHCRAYGDDDDMGTTVGASQTHARESHTEHQDVFKESRQNLSEPCDDLSSSDSDVDSDWEINVDSVQDEPEDACPQAGCSAGICSTEPLSGLPDVAGFDK